MEGKSKPCKEVIMELFSKEYGWTPTEIKQLTIREVIDYMDIINTRNKIENRKLKTK